MIARLAFIIIWSDWRTVRALVLVGVNKMKFIALAHSHTALLSALDK